MFPSSWHARYLLLAVPWGKQLKLLPTEKRVFVLRGGAGRGKVWCCSGNTVMNIDKCNLNVIFGGKKKVFFSALTYCSCQRLLNKPGGCVEGRSTEPCPQGAAVGCSTALSVRCWRHRFPPLPALALALVPLTFLTLRSAPLLHLTAASFSQTVSSLLPGHTYG